VEGVFGVKGATGIMGLVGMRQLILSMGLAWVVVRILTQRATIPSKMVPLLFLIDRHVLNAIKCTVKMLVLLIYFPLCR
jgi:hypothetical protein